MKVLLCSSSSGSRGGGELCLLYLGESLARAGHAVTLWASTHPRMDELAAGFAPFGPVVRSPYPNTYDRPLRSLAYFASRPLARRIGSEWRALAPDVVHLNKQNLEDGLELLWAANATGRPSVCMIHITQSARFLRAKAGWLRDAVAAFGLRRFRGCYVTTPASRVRQLREFVGPGREVVDVLNGVPLPDLKVLATQRESQRAQLGLTEGDFLLLGVGRMAPQKRPLLFLELASQISCRVPCARFVWVGDGVLSPAWDEWVRARGLGGVVRRVSWQTDVKPFLAAADLFLHTAHFEGLPFAVLEAMAAGRACALPSELAAELDVFNPDQAFSYDTAEDLIRLIQIPARVRDLAQAGRTLAEATLSSTRMAERYLELYQRLTRPGEVARATERC